MPAHDHSDAANNAIAEKIHDMRPSVKKSWMTLKPTGSPLNFGEGNECMDFFGRIILLYQQTISPCQCLPVDTFAEYQSETLITFRDAMLEATTCV